MVKKTKKKVMKKVAKKRIAKQQVVKERKMWVTNPWFKRRVGNDRSSWGIIPINWKGWITLFLLVFLNVFSANYFDIMNAPFEDVSKALVVFFLSIVVFILISRKKTKGVEI